MKISIAIALLSLASCAPKRSTVEPGIQIDQGPIADVNISNINGERCATIIYPCGLSSLADVAALLPKRALFNVLPDGVDFFTVEPVEDLLAWRDYDFIYTYEPSVITIRGPYGILEIRNDSKMPEPCENMRMNLEMSEDVVILRFRMPNSERPTMPKPKYQYNLYRLRLKELILGTLARYSGVRRAPSAVSLYRGDELNRKSVENLETVFAQDVLRWEFSTANPV